MNVNFDNAHLENTKWGIHADFDIIKYYNNAHIVIEEMFQTSLGM